MRIAVCDDNKEYIDEICRLIKLYEGKYTFEIDIFMSGEEFIQCNKKYDIIFLDIEMQAISGLDVAASIRSKKDDAIIIFITSYVNYISDTFRLGAFQFLVKPFSEEDFKIDFERAINTYISKHMKYMVKWREKIFYIEYNEIIYIEAYDRHLYIITENQKYECVGKITEAYDKLKLYGFIRCHQGYIVNVRKIKMIDKSGVMMGNMVQLPVSRKYKSELQDGFNMYLAGEIV